MSKHLKLAQSASGFSYDHSRLLNNLTENLRGMVYCNVYDEYWTMVYVSEGAKTLTGYSPDELIHNNVISYEEVTFEEDRVQVRNIIEASVLNKSSFEIEYRIRQKNGNIAWVVEYGSPIFNTQGQIVALQGYIDNIDQRKKSELMLHQTETRYRSIFENSLEGIFQTTSTGMYLLANAALARIYGYSSKEELMQSLHDIQSQLYVLPNRRLEFVNAVEAFGFVNNFESQIQRKDGSVIWISESARKVCDSSGNFLYYEGLVRDISELKTALEHSKSSMELANQTLDELNFQKLALDEHCIVAITDAKGTITYANQKFCDVSGYSKDELIGQDHKIVNSGFHKKNFFKHMYQTISRGKTWSGEICNRAKDGRLYWVETTIVPFLGKNGKPTKYIAIRTDITRCKNAEERNSNLALYDSLTSLPNRRLLADRLQQAIISSSRSGMIGALLFLDLDNFKTVNDSLGHNVGDLLLQEFSKHILKCVRASDTVSRLGGDEFVILIEDLGLLELEAAAIVESICEKLLESLISPFKHLENEFHITTSIGVAFFGDKEKTCDEVLKNADIAMYQAKKSGRNLVRFFDPLMQINIRERLNLEKDLRNALVLNQLHLYYQIQVDVAGNSIGAEALIRWKHPVRNLVSPFHFIPLAEESGLILPIGQWVLETACRQLKYWQENSTTRHLTLSINVSAKQFHQPEFVNQVLTCIKDHNIAPEKLKIELTESMLFENLEETILTMNTLKENGIRFSLDDFGTGYSSLQYLKKLPLNELKIDQSFVRDIVTDKNDEAIVKTIIVMAKTLNMNVIAEGVETEMQRNMLIELGCSNFQGYLFGKPLPIELLKL